MSTVKIVKVSQGKVVDYSVKKDGFKPVIGSSLITSDKTINVKMVSTTSSTSAYNFGDRIGDIATVVGDYTDDNGQTYTFAVLDAKYMGVKQWYKDDPTSEAFGLRVVDFPPESNSHDSATYNTNVILSRDDASDFQAFNFAHSTRLDIGGATYYSQLPNAYEVRQIYNMRNEIYDVDPTKNDFPDYNLSTWTFKNGSEERNCVWTSSIKESGLYYRPHLLMQNGVWNTDGGASRNYYWGVTPIFEIPHN